jgi:hypothetical protein
MAEAPDNGEGQATLDVLFNSPQAAGTVVQVRAGDGTIVATFQSSKSFQSLVVSSPELVAGQTYDLIVKLVREYGRYPLNLPAE